MKIQHQPPSDIFIKVVFKNSTFNLGKGITIFDHLIQQIKKRFSSVTNFQLFFNEKTVTYCNFPTLLQVKSSQGQKSLKLEMKQVQESKKKVAQENNSQKYHFNPKEVQDEFQQLQNQNKAQELFEVLTLNEKQEIKNQKESSIDIDQIKIKLLIQDQSKSLEVELGTQYYWHCTLLNQSQSNVPNQVCIRDFTTQKLIQITPLSPKQSKHLIFGPYQANEVGKQIHFYEIIYTKNDDNYQSLGAKFGFVCLVNKKLPSRSIECKMNSRINFLRNFSVCEKSTEHIIKKLKQSGINEECIDQFEDQELIQFIDLLNQK